MAESMSDSATTWMVYEICCACASGAAQSANSTASTALKAVRCEAVGRRCGFTLEVLPLEQYYRQRREQRSVEGDEGDRKSTRLNSSHVRISYAVFCLKKKKKTTQNKHY